MSIRDTSERNIVTMESTISNFLRVGVTISAIVILTGLIMLLISRNSGYPGETFPTTVTAILRGLVSLKPYAIILSGLLLLVLTPVFRVAVSVLTFFQEKDYLYMGITTAVLLVLLIGFLLGKMA